MQPKSVALDLLAVHRDLLFILEVYGNRFRRMLRRDQHSILLRSRIATQTFRFGNATGREISPQQYLAMKKKIVIEDWGGMRHQVRYRERLFVRSSVDGLAQELILWHYGQIFFLGFKLLPSVTNDFPFGSEFQFRTLHSPALSF